MNIGHLINRLSSGGASTVIRNIIGRDSKNNHTICCMENVIEIDPAEIDGQIVELEEEFKFDPRAIYRLYRVLQRENFDIIHLHLPYSQTVGRLLAQFSDVDCIISTQHNVPENYHPITQSLETVSRPVDDVTVSVTDDVREASEGTQLGWLVNSHTDWITIHNGIEVSKFNKQVKQVETDTFRKEIGCGDGLVFLNVSHYIEQKAQTDLIKAMDNLVEYLPDAKLFLVGRGPLEQQLRAEVRERDLQENVTVTGYVSQNDLYRYYALADVFVLSSLSEGFGIVLIEAMAAELPVIATNVLGGREVVNHGSTGVLVSPSNPEELMEAMRSLQDIELRHQYSKNGYKRAKNEFSAEKSANEYIRLYDKC